LDDQELLATLGAAGQLDATGAADDPSEDGSDPERPAGEYDDQDADAPEAEDAEEGEDDGPDPDSPDPAEEPSEPDLTPAERAELAALRAEREQVLRLRAEQAEAQSKAYWDDQWNGIVSEYHKYQAWIEENADKSFNSAGFRAEHNQKLANWWQQQTSEYQGKREAAIYQAQARRELPRYAAEVAKHYGLPEEYIPELLRVAQETENPNAMNSVAAVLQKAVRAQRKTKARELAASAAAPGTGQAAPRTKHKAGSDAQLLDIFARAQAR
jgi:hypothetical protein